MQQAASLQGRRVLVVEDDFLVAQTLSDALEDAGATVVGPIGWAGEAATFVRGHSADFDSALLDVNLHGERSYRVADALAERKVRFVFMTGYGTEAIDEAYRHHPRCEKPIRMQALLDALSPPPRLIQALALDA